MKALKLSMLLLATTIISACSTSTKTVEEIPVKKEYISVQLKSYAVDLSKRASKKILDCEPFDHDEPELDYKSICSTKMQWNLTQNIKNKNDDYVLKSISEYGFTKVVNQEVVLVENGERLDNKYEIKIKSTLKKPKSIGDDDIVDNNKSDLTYSPIIIMKSDKILVNYIYYYSGDFSDRNNNNHFDTLGNKILNEKETAILYISNIEDDKYLVTTISAEKLND